MRRVLMVSPHFPPDSSAASHRVRLLAPHLEEAGWSPTVVTLERSAYEGRLDPGLEALVPDVAARRARAGAGAPTSTRRVGLGDLGLRAFTGLRNTCRAAAGPRAFRRAVHHRISRLSRAPRHRSEIRVPRAVRPRLSGSLGRRVGPVGRRRTGRRAGLEEPRVAPAWHVARAEGRQRRRCDRGGLAGHASTASSSVFRPRRGCRTASFHSDSNPPTSRRCERAPEGARASIAADGFVHLCYVGTLLPTGVGTLRLLLRGLARARRDDPAAARLRLHFFGTSNQSDSNAYRVLPIARECGVADAVTEMPGRLDYLDALSVSGARVRDSCCSAVRNGTTRRASYTPRCWRSGRSSRCSTRRAASSRSCAHAGSEPTVRVRDVRRR